MTEQLHFHLSLSCIGEGNGNPLQCSCLENPREGGAWWAAVYGVAQNWTRLKWLSSHHLQWFWRPKIIKSATVTTVFPSISQEVMGLDAMIFIFWGLLNFMKIKSSVIKMTIRPYMNIYTPPILPDVIEYSSFYCFSPSATVSLSLNLPDMLLPQGFGTCYSSYCKGSYTKNIWGCRFHCIQATI